MSRPTDWPRPKDRPIEQVLPMFRAFPQFTCRWNHCGGLVWRGFLQPTPESPRYPIVIVHNPTESPRVFVPGHGLDPDCRHLYRNRALCLYWPRAWWWTPGENLVSTMVPWTAFWLYYYELWQTTGRWLGPSSPHGLRPEDTN